MQLCTLFLLLATAIGSWVDPDTSYAHLQTISNVDGRKFDLVFSDEFEVIGRSFNDGYDSRWTAIHKNDYTNTALQFYDKKRVLTSAGGHLNITTIAKKTAFLAKNDRTGKYHTTHQNFSSGMLQSWNKFCFTGGIIEIQAKLPGSAHIGGLWPAMWMLGNLARATYVGSSNWIWPWSFDTCNRDLQPKQLISACSPNVHYGMDGFTGRGAPEIDILEAMPGLQKLPPSPVGKPYFSTSLQIAPGVPDHRPGNGGPPGPGSWYEGLEYGKNSSQNIFFYGSMNTKSSTKYSYQSDAISGNTQLSKQSWENEFHRYRLEWALPQSQPDPDQGYIRWFLDDQQVYGITGKSLSAMVSGSMIPTEPQYIILNTALSSSWGFPQPCPANCDCSCFDCTQPAFSECGCGIAKGFCEMLPAHFLIDYVRVFQLKSDPHQKVGCSTPERPTKKWIEGHADEYMEVGDSQPLTNLQVGGGICADSTECLFGVCVDHHCVCDSTHIGPLCAAHHGFDPIDWTADPGLDFYTPVLPPLFLAGFFSLVVLVLTMIWIRVNKLRGDSFRNPVGVLEDSTRISYQMQKEVTENASHLSERQQTYSLSSRVSEVQLSDIPIVDN